MSPTSNTSPRPKHVVRASLDAAVATVSVVLVVFCGAGIAYSFVSGRRGFSDLIFSTSLPAFAALTCIIVSLLAPAVFAKGRPEPLMAVTVPLVFATAMYAWYETVALPLTGPFGRLKISPATFWQTPALWILAITVSTILLGIALRRSPN